MKVIYKLFLMMNVIVMAAPSIPSGKFTRNQDGSLKFTIPHLENTLYIDLHFSVNKPLQNVDAGDYFTQIRTQGPNGEWEYSNPDIKLKPGDTVNYWLILHTTKGGLQKTGMSSLIAGTTSTSQATSTTRETTTPTTTKNTAPTNFPSTVQRSTENSDAVKASTSSKSNQTGTSGMSTSPTTTTPTPGSATGPGSGSATCKGSKSVSCTKYPCVIFEDNFDTLDLETWEHEITASGGGNWEFQMYVNNRSNSWVNNSKLHIRPTLTADVYDEQFLSTGNLDIWGETLASQCTANQFYGCSRQGTGSNFINPIQSARLRTAKSFSFRYGKVEVEAKLPKGDWLWPAIWMLPRYEHYGLWPASGEIDIVESRGNANYKDENGKPFGVDWMASTLHWGPYYGQNAYLKTHVEKNAKSGDFSSGFHKYAVEWDDEKIVFYLDDEDIMVVSPGKEGFWKFGKFDQVAPGSNNPWASDGSPMAPFDREFYLIINLAVGGTNGFFPDQATNGGYPKPWNDKSQTGPRDFWHGKAQWYPTWKYPDDTLQVNYVRVTKLKPDP